MKNVMTYALLLFAGVGCVSQDAVVFSTGTTFGFETQGAEAGGSAVTLGYKRGEFVSMPMRDENGKVLPAFSTLALFNFESDGFTTLALGEHRLQQLFATGNAAKRSVSSGSAGKAFQAMRGLASSEEVERQRDIDTMIREANSADRAAMVAVVSDELARGADLGDPGVVDRLISARFTGDELADKRDDFVTNRASAAEVALELVDWAIADGDDEALERIRRSLAEIAR